MSALDRAAPVLAAALLATGCAADTPTGADEGLRVVASHYPLEYVATRVAGGHAEVTGLTAPGVEPHDLELSVHQTAAVSDADVVVFQRGFQPAVDAAVDQSGAEHVVDAARVAGEDHAAHQEEPGDGHDHAGDPHFWLDPLETAAVADAVAEALADADADHADDYRDNAAALRADLQELDGDLERGLARCEVDTVVVSHDAYRHLERYGLHFEPVSGVSADAEASPARLAELHDLVAREGVTTVFAEPLLGEQTVGSLAADLGLEVGVLDPIEGLTEDTAGEDYLTLMRANLAALREANRCR